MRTVQSVLIAVLLTASSAALAQQAGIEDRLSPAEFRAAGLDKLSTAELARLNELLARDSAAAPTAAPAAPVATDVEARIAQAREEGRREARTADLGKRPPQASREPLESTISGPFHGFARGREYVLANGQVWKQVDSASLAGARGQDVAARIRPGLLGVWWLQVDGYNTQAKVERVR
ncbi:hypothetical protein CNR27_05590 [Luteimonas chenhongjianii]|uniref:Secreted protein n=1 Tax=Luteimonas chenhongjianii TaxID=2006110 RepID=A0A290XCY1_9GAMM|nr:hypothetical protein [Luteimonas chenhongjianii]ATD66980.1 hypothetical protein CNR27_05590 [Luteimonas chenhongjianii]